MQVVEKDITINKLQFQCMMCVTNDENRRQQFIRNYRLRV